MISEGLQRIADYIKSHDDFILISHIGPDGDTIGSALSLYFALKTLGKKVQVTCQDRVPETYRFLPEMEVISYADKAIAAENVIAIDCADLRRLGKAQWLFDSAKHTINIDHHRTNTLFAQQNEVRECAATGEIIYDLIMLLTGYISHEIGVCIYIAIMTDTGNFAFSNTTADTFRLAAKLVDLGVVTCVLNERVYRTVPERKKRLLGFSMMTMEMHHSAEIAVCVLTLEDLARYNATSEDAEGIIDNMLDVDTVKVAVFMKECADGGFKASLRSKGRINVADVAEMFGGGGHKNAAGFKIDGDMLEAQESVVRMISEVLD